MFYHYFSLTYSFLSSFLDHFRVDTYMMAPHVNLNICIFHQDMDIFLDNLSSVVSLRKLTLGKYLASHYRCQAKAVLSVRVRCLQCPYSTRSHPHSITHSCCLLESSLICISPCLACLSSISLSVLENKAQWFYVAFVLHLHGSLQSPVMSGVLPEAPWSAYVHLKALTSI